MTVAVLQGPLKPGVSNPWTECTTLQFLVILSNPEAEGVLKLGFRTRTVWGFGKCPFCPREAQIGMYFEVASESILFMVTRTRQEYQVLACYQKLD